MEMTHTTLLYILAGIGAAALIVVIFLMKGKKYTEGARSANNRYIKKLSQYKTLIFE